MSNIKEIINANLGEVSYEKFLRPNNKLVLDANRIDLAIFCGEGKKSLKTITNGDTSLMLRYKEREGMVISLETETEELKIVQLQGARSKGGYQIATGFFFVDFFGSQIKKITDHPESWFRRIVMPSLGQIDGLYETNSEPAMNRYQKLADNLGMKFSEQEFKFVREIKKTI